MDKIIEREHESAINNQILATSVHPSDEFESHINEIDTTSNFYEENLAEKKSEEFSSSEKINVEDANTTNCLALTIKKDYKLVAVKNVFLHTLKVTWKVIVSTVTLTIFKYIF
jgi:hypothetical protein